MSGQNVEVGAFSLKNGFNAKGASVRRKKASGHRVTLRLSDDEFGVLKSRAQGKSLSAYIRACIFESETTPRKVRSRTALKSETAIAQVLGLLGQSEIATNLSELTDYAREGSLLLDDVTFQQIEEAHSVVMSMRDHLMAALGLIENQTR